MANRRIDGQSRAALTPGRRRGPALPAAAVLVAVAAALSNAAATACRATTVEGIAGWEGDRYAQGYGFAMLGTSWRAGEGFSIPARIAGSYLYYDYRDAGERVDVDGPGLSAMAGLRRNGDWGSVECFAGGDVRWERRRRERSAESPAPVAVGGATAQIDADIAWGRRAHPFALVNYAGSSRYVYGRGGLRWQMTNLDWRAPTAWSLVLEGVRQGNADTDATQVGGGVECAVVRSRLSLSVRGGYKVSDASSPDRREGGYVGAGLYRRF